MQPFHKLTLPQQRKAFVKYMTCEEFEAVYSQPVWCDYPFALRGIMGCWSLVDGKIRGIKDCKDCDLRILDKKDYRK